MLKISQGPHPVFVLDLCGISFIGQFCDVDGLIMVQHHSCHHPFVGQSPGGSGDPDWL